MPEPPVDRVLVVTAHPDDVDFAAAGAVATWTDAGVAVSYCIVTDGDAGGFEPGVDRAEMAAMRRAEQQAAAACVGAGDAVFLGYPDGRVEVSLGLRRDLARVIRSVRPQRVVTHCPQRSFTSIYHSHPDHLAVGEAVLCAVYPDARNPFAHPELAAQGYGPHVVSEVWMMGGPEPNEYLDITDHFDRKLEALHCHASQHPEPDGLEDRIRGWNVLLAQEGGLPAGRVAEAFQRIATG